MTQPAGQITWQRQGAALLGRLLELAAQQGLPVIAWTVQNAGASLVGQVLSHPDSQRREQLAAWCQAITAAAGRPPDADRETTTPGGETRLAARWDWLPAGLTPTTRPGPGVRVALTASIWPGDAEEAGQ